MTGWTLFSQSLESQKGQRKKGNPGFLAMRCKQGCCPVLDSIAMINTMIKMQQGSVCFNLQLQVPHREAAGACRCKMSHLIHELRELACVLPAQLTPLLLYNLGPEFRKQYQQLLVWIFPHLSAIKATPSHAHGPTWSRQSSTDMG